MVEHEAKPFARDIARCFPINGITERHIIGGDGFGDRAGRANRLEKYPGHFLAGANFSEGAVDACVEIYRKGLTIGGQEFLLLTHGGIR